RDDPRRGARADRGGRGEGHRLGIEKDRLRGGRGRGGLQAGQGAGTRRRGPGRKAIPRTPGQEMKITKAVYPVAGLGTRFLPVTKASPKEMLPIVDKPLIQYAVEEAIEAGIKDMIFVTGRGKRAIEDHFDKAYELEAELQAHGKITM